MRTKILGAALMATALISMPAMARKQDKKSDKSNQKIELRAGTRLNEGCERGRCIYDALNLSDDQKIKLDAANKKYRTDKQTLYNNAGKESRENNDSIRNVVRKKAMQLKEQNLKDIKSILTTDQYIQFLEQNYLQEQNYGKSRPNRGNKPQRKYQEQFRAAPMDTPIAK